MTTTSKPPTKSKAIATSKAGLQLQKLLLDNGAINVDELNKLLSTKGLKAVAKGVQTERYSRILKVTEWATEGRELTKDEQATIRKLPKVIGLAPVMTSEASVRVLTQDEIDLWAEETVVEREAKDILEGLNQRRRSTFFNVARKMTGEPLPEDVVFTSPKWGIKFEVDKSGSSPEPDYSRLEGVVERDVWEDITDEVTVREVNETKLKQALQEGKISLDLFMLMVPERKEWPVLRVTNLKPGDAV